MITLPSGYNFDFVVASGALGFDGRGYWWEKPLRWLGKIDSHQFLVITKTLTMKPRKGNLRWWRPWRCVAKYKDGWINAVGLTNPGIHYWLNTYFHNIVEDRTAVAVSIAPETLQEASMMSFLLTIANSTALIYDGFKPIQAIELNVSCPNSDHVRNVTNIVSMIKVMKPSGLPIFVKLGWTQPYMEICKAVQRDVAAFDLINAIPWNYFTQSSSIGNVIDFGDRSPLEKYGLEGGISGPPIAPFGIGALDNIINAEIDTPVISGGGVYDISGVISRFNRGAGAVSFGSLFLSHPTMPNKLVNEWRSKYAASYGTHLGESPR